MTCFFYRFRHFYLRGFFMSFYCLIVCLTETLVSGSTRSLMTGGHIRPQTPRRSTSLTSGNSPMSTKTRYESFYMKVAASLLCFLYIKSKILFTLNYIHYLISFGGLVQRLYVNQHFFRVYLWNERTFCLSGSNALSPSCPQLRIHHCPTYLGTRPVQYR